jgi:hypothetical protein
MKADERYYSHRSLYDKLGVQADSRVKSASTLLRATYDIIFFRVDAPPNTSNHRHVERQST